MENTMNGNGTDSSVNEDLSVPGSPIDRLKEISSWVSSVLDLGELLEHIINAATATMKAKAMAQRLQPSMMRSRVRRAPILRSMKLLGTSNRL